ncbi:RNA-binding protein 42-like [Asterias rubens]|uniref:RNA-binding protein 42-like n=1 Tax=Asterias rubens TaxID=7604 RepID=UPI001455D93A|nr:RNA-binding protein 42-like [Asterias rubens]
MAAPVNVGLAAERGEMSEMKMMEEEMSRFEQEILTRRDENAKSRSFTAVRPSDTAPPTALVPPGIPQALSVLGTPDPSLMNLYFPPPPPEATPLPHHRSIQPEPPGSYDPIPTKEMGFSAPVPTPVAPSQATSSNPVMAPHGAYQAPGSENPTLGQSEPSPLQLAAQQFAAESQQMHASGGMQPAPRPSFVPHQVRARAPLPPAHRPPFNQHMQRPRMQQMYQVPPRGPMMPHGFPMMPRHAMGAQRPPAVISAKPTTYSAKPVRFSKTKKAQNTEVSAVTHTAVATVTKQPEYNVNPTPYAQPAIAQQQAAMQMFTASTHQPAAAVNYSTMGQQQQQQQLQQQQQQQPEGAAGSSDQQKKKDKKKKFVRTAASTMWEDESLAEWDQNDFRIFCGDIGNEVTDELLTKVFGRYPSFIKAKVVRDKRTNKTKGYGFVSFKDPNDFVQAMREWNGKYVGNRPIKLRKSSWKDRNIDTFKKKQREKQKLGLK